MTFCTYIYRDPKTSAIVYVGKGAMSRPRSHLKKSSKTRLSYLLRKRLSEGYVLNPIIIKAESDADAKEMERLLIALIGREDQGLGPLFNLTDGGEGMTNPSLKTRQLLSEAGKASKATFETQERWRSSTSKVFASDEYKIKRSQASKALGARKEVQDSKRKAMSTFRSIPEIKEHYADMMRERWKDQEYRKKMFQSHGKQCTVDGSTFYNSAKELCAVLGYGKDGYRSPTFRYV